MKRLETTPVKDLSAPDHVSRIWNISAPFRGYGMERIPALRAVYGYFYDLMTKDDIRTLRVGSLTLLADMSDRSIVPSLRITGRYEATFSRALDDLLRPGSTYVDVGAHIGYHSVRAAKRVGNTGRVIAYEPEPATSNLLDLNVRRNEVFEWTTVNRLAVGASHGRGTLWLNGSNTGGASLTKECVGEVSRAQSVDVVPLDYHLIEVIEDVEKIDVMKVDVQGHEYDVIDGADKLIERDWPAIGFEYNPDQLAGAGSDGRALLGHLATMDYRFYAADEYRHVVGQLNCDEIHRWCMTEKSDGSSGFLNIIAVHRSVDRWQ